MTLREALTQIAETGKKLGDTEYVICQKRKNQTVFLSDSMYLWTGFREKAFVFASRKQALDMVEQFPEDLKGAVVGGFSK